MGEDGYVRFYGIQALERVTKRLAKIGIELELIGNVPWVYLGSVNGIPVTEKENVMDIEWQEGAVCFAGSSQWFSSCKDNQLISKCGSYGGSLDECISSYNYQLNTIKQFDYIAASELDEQKYNDVVGVFGLFGFENASRFDFLDDYNVILSGSIVALIKEGCLSGGRKLTYPQIMAIGEIKRMMIERDKPKTK